MLDRTSTETDAPAGHFLPDSYVRFTDAISRHHDDRLRDHILSLGGDWPIPKRERRLLPIGPRLKITAKNEMSISAAERSLRIGAALGWAANFSDDGRDGARTVMLLCRLWGLCVVHAREAIGDAMFDPVAAGRAWAPYLSEPDHRILGAVYVAERRDSPEVIKIGFSTDVCRRLKQVSSSARAPMRLIAAHPGTMLHEWALHQMIPHRREMKPEWYWRRDVPTWLMGPLPAVEVAA